MSLDADTMLVSSVYTMLGIASECVNGAADLLRNGGSDAMVLKDLLELDAMRRDLSDALYALTDGIKSQPIDGRDGDGAEAPDDGGDAA